MTKEEWLQIGYSNGLITSFDLSELLSFGSVYKMWFQSKINTIKPQSIDRIECTYNKYYKAHSINYKYINEIDENYINEFLNGIIISRGNITKKEYCRIYQIINNVIQYAIDCNIGHCHDIKWTFVKRYVAIDNLVKAEKKEYIIPMSDRVTLFKAVIDENIYPEKDVICLAIILNFYLGLRIGELASLMWKDVNFDEHYVFVHNTFTKSFMRDSFGNRLDIKYYSQDTTKTVNSVRKVPLINESIYIFKRIKMLQEQKNYCSDYVCYNGTETIISKSIERCITRLCKLCGINHFSSHMIRKTFATELHHNGVPTRIISDLMGHSEIRTTEKCYILTYDESINYCRKIMQDCLVVDLK